MTAPLRPPLLLTPGPLTTARQTREAMQRDYGSRDRDFIVLNAGVLARLTALAGGGETHACVPVQGSGTFAVEAAIGTLVPHGGKLLILENGAYGARMARICEIIGRDSQVLQWPENEPVSIAEIGKALLNDGTITHVAVVHCETTSGILNPLEDVAEIVSKHDRGLLIDAMSSFGALPIDVEGLPCEALMASSNKCLEGVPGMGFVIARKSALEASQGNAHSLSLDLTDQWQAMEKTGQWRFTPPTHVLAALASALDQHEAEGGVAGRGERYRGNWRLLVDGMRELGFQTLLGDDLQAPIIVTFLTPADPNYDFEAFYKGLAGKGFVIYPGKLTKADSFRIGCIGQVGAEDMRALIVAVKSTLGEMGVTSAAPVKG